MIVLAIDTETTGLVTAPLMPLDRQPHVIQFSGLLVEIDRTETTILDEFTTFIKPPRKELFSEKISKLTQITWENLENAPPFADVAERIFDDLIYLSPAVAAHNLSFDRMVLDFEAQRLGREIVWPERMICTVEQTNYVKGFRLDLGGLHEGLHGEKFAGAHQASADVGALVRCLITMHERGMI